MSENYMQKPSHQSSKDKGNPARSNITTITGTNSFSLSRLLKQIIDDFQVKNGELAIERFDAEEAEASNMMEAILALPFLSSAKMVVIRKGSANKDFAEQIEQNISSIPGSTELILYEPQIDRRTAYFKVLKSQTQFEELGSLSRNELSKWLISEAQNLGAKLGYSEANYLLERLGENQQLLFNELSKLAIYDSAITRANIDLLTEPTPQSKVFDLLDAAFAGRKKRALELYEDQRAQKVEPQAILAMLSWQLYILTLLVLAEGRSTNQIAKESGISSYPLDKASKIAENLSPSQLRTMINEALSIDERAKSTSLDLDEALKTYITTL